MPKFAKPYISHERCGKMNDGEKCARMKIRKISHSNRVIKLCVQCDKTAQ